MSPPAVCSGTSRVLVLLLTVLLHAGWVAGKGGLPRDRPAKKDLRVGAFNIRAFGKAKMSRDAVAGHIKKIVERYDVLLIQEIRDKSMNSVRQLKDMLEPPFDFVISQRLGRTAYKEQYAYFYRTDYVTLLGTYQYKDPHDVFEREPFVAKIAPKFASCDMISLIALHSKPDNATAEIGHLRDVIDRTLEEMGHDSEPVVVGDLNADCSYADLAARQEANDYLTVNNIYTWLIGEDADTTTRASTDCAYDRIIVRSSLQDKVVLNSPIVFDYGQWLSLTEKEALDVSDHYPVEMTLRF